MIATGLRVLLVGGASEIGLAIVRVLAGPSGATVVLAGRPSSRLDIAAADLRDQGHVVHVVDYDATWSAAATAQVLRASEAHAAGLDVVVVAVGQLSPETETAGPDAAPHTRRQAHVQGRRSDAPRPSEPGLDTLLQTNLIGPALVANEATDLLCDQGRGHLIVVTSAAAVRPRGGILGYAVAKQALDSLVRGLDVRARPHGVRCLVVRPGRVRTRMTAGLPSVPLTTEPEQVAARVRTALRRNTSVVWSPAPLGAVSRALMLVPAWAMPRGLR